MKLHGAGVALALVLAAASLPAGAQDVAPAPATPAAAVTPSAAPAAPAYSPKGADTCLKCHDESSRVPVMDIFKTPHGRKADPRTPFAQLQCETCHGPGAEHARKKPAGDPQGPIRTFGLEEETPVAEQNGVCLSCHSGKTRTHWAGSAHDSADVPCAGCHVVHAATDAVRERTTQTAVCATCHPRERAATLSAFAHPLRQGRMGCSDCHQVHGSAGDSLLVKASTNETCHTCHADKRGPFLWEHEPASEDCTLCHAPHGSPHPAMLTQRPPLLCQQCHSQDGHPSLARTPGGLPGNAPSAFLLVNGCANCHSQIHGSNHPSGAGLAR